MAVSMVIRRRFEQENLKKNADTTATFIVGGLPSGKLTVCYRKWPFIVDFPIKNGDFP